MEKKGRGSTEIWVSSVDNVELRAVKWFDNMSVTLLSTYESVEPTKNVERFDKKASKCVNVSCPSIVTTYNQFMGEVDLLDGVLSFYRIHIRSKKWYHKLLYHFFDIAVVQSWLLYRRDLMFLSIPEMEWIPLKETRNSYFCVTPKNYWLMFIS